MMTKETQISTYVGFAIALWLSVSSKFFKLGRVCLISNALSSRSAMSCEYIGGCAQKPEMAHQFDVLVE